jgi:hypothetical protein
MNIIKNYVLLAQKKKNTYRDFCKLRVCEYTHVRVLSNDFFIVKNTVNTKKA